MQPAATEEVRAPREGTEVSDAPGLASPPPVFFTVVLWLGAFFTIAWGFRVLLLRLSRTEPSVPTNEARSPHAEDVTLDEPGPDRS